MPVVLKVIRPRLPSISLRYIRDRLLASEMVLIKKPPASQVVWQVIRPRLELGTHGLKGRCSTN